MYVTLVHAHVAAQHVDDFIEACRVNHLASIHEPGNLRFDILQMAEDPTRFILYEAYEGAEAARGHKETPHYAAWRDAVAPWMAEPRKGVVYEGLFP
jgi:autoinducer 2-degrading protein